MLKTETHFKNWMIWSLASKQIFDLMTVNSPEEVQSLIVEVLNLTKVSWPTILQAMLEIDTECNSRWN